MITPNTNSVTDLETLYESTTLKESIRNHYNGFTLESIDALLESDQELGDLELEVIEELFGRTRAKLAGAGAKLGAQASNLRNRATTGISNAKQKAGAYANNIKNIGKQGLNAVQGQYQTGDLAQGQVDPASVGNQQAQIQDPNQAATAAKLQTILPELQKSISSTFSKIDGDLQALGLDANSLGQINPNLSRYLNYAKGALKKAHTELSKAIQ